MHAVLDDVELRWIAFGIVSAMIAGYILGYFL